MTDTHPLDLSRAGVPDRAMVVDIHDQSAAGEQSDAGPLNAVLTFLAQPLPLEDPSLAPGDAAGIAHLHVQRLMVAGLECGMLPRSARVVQFIFVHPGDVRLDLDIPTAIHPSLAGSEQRILQAIAVTGRYAMRDRVSFFAAAAKTNEDKGLISIISTRVEGVRDWTILNGRVHVVRSHIASVPPLDRVAVGETQVEAETIGTIGWRVWPARRAAQAILATADYGAFDAAPQIKTGVNWRLKKLLGADAEAHVVHAATFAEFGEAVVLVAPKVLIEGSAASGEAGGGGCLVVLNSDPSDEELAALYVFAHRLVSALSGVLALARRSVSARAVETFGFIRHSLRDTLIRPVGATPERTRRLLRLEDVALAAAGALLDERLASREDMIDWSSGGDDGEPLGETIREAFRTLRFDLEFDDGPLVGTGVDPRVVALIIELCKNLHRRAAQDARPTIRARIGDREGPTIAVEVCTLCSADNIAFLLRKLSRRPEALRAGGVDWIVRLFEALRARSTSRVSWKCESLQAENEPSIEVAPPGSAWTVQLPERVAGSEESWLGETFRLRFEAHGMRGVHLGGVYVKEQ